MTLSNTISNFVILLIKIFLVEFIGVFKLVLFINYLGFIIDIQVRRPDSELSAVIV